MMRVDAISHGALQLTQPEFHLGQKVRIGGGRVGYIAGLVFYPDTATWSYGIYLPDHEGGKIYEVWYDAEDITLSDH